jgi:hypothetical protein
MGDGGWERGTYGGWCHQWDIEDTGGLFDFEQLCTYSSGKGRIPFASQPTPVPRDLALNAASPSFPREGLASRIGSASLQQFSNQSSNSELPYPSVMAAHHIRLALPS